MFVFVYVPSTRIEFYFTYEIIRRILCETCSAYQMHEPNLHSRIYTDSAYNLISSLYRFRSPSAIFALHFSRVNLNRYQLARKLLYNFSWQLCSILWLLMMMAMVVAVVGVCVNSKHFFNWPLPVAGNFYFYSIFFTLVACCQMRITIKIPYYYVAGVVDADAAVAFAVAVTVKIIQKIMRYFGSNRSGYYRKVLCENVCNVNINWRRTFLCLNAQWMECYICFARNLDFISHKIGAMSHLENLIFLMFVIYFLI